MHSPTIDDYDLGQVVGAGTVGTIYLATERDTGYRVAIKKLHPGVSRDPLIRARFERETTILQRLRHPNIVACYGGGEIDGGLYYIMELVDGGTVKDLLESNGPLPWPSVVDVTRQICSALQYAHNHGVIHRDLKPGNLFLTTDAVVKLGDFGIARDLHSADLTSSGLTVGTHAYMSPEQITGDALISGKTDLYALGCCVMEMLTGRKPFLGENFAQLFEQHLRAAPPRARDLVGDCPPELDEVINELLAKDPEDRPFNARSVQGVMLEIGEKYHLDAPLDSGPDSVGHDDPADVAASSATEGGRRMLEKQIRSRMGGGPRADVSWGRLAAIVAVVAGLIGALMMAQS
ncbi:serine/threonine protein kinase [Crateriforma spongiae]|uniref:serine/threonine protein kinase n=1 Tax=Crateriforma spongiae TaxID=2724528 RepID=UPI0039B050B0